MRYAFSSDDPRIYEDVYSSLKTFIDSCLDVHKVKNILLLVGTSG